MAEAKWCGHDSRGTKIPHNDLPQILKNLGNKTNLVDSPLGYRVPTKKILNNVLAPRYYEPSTSLELLALKKTHSLLLIQDLVDSGVLEFATGIEVGKLAYGTGEIPFVRTSDISNWEIKLDAKHGVSEEIYQSSAGKLDVREGDILMVRDGTYLIGTCGYVSKYDEKMVYQSHIYKIRVKKSDILSPYLLLAALSSKPVVAQIQSKRFTQDIIDTLGNRVYELVLPIPKDRVKRERIEKMVEKSVSDRIEARELARIARDEIA
jgi:type I restriction enzyme M protein